MGVVTPRKGEMIESSVLTEMSCPMGCGKTIHTSREGLVLCVNPDCPDMRAIGKIMDGEHIAKHRIKFSRGHWSCVHPIFERIENKLLDCDIERAVSEMGYYGVDNGELWTWFDETDQEWKWKRIEDGD